MTTRKIPPVHPGEMLREEFMKPLGLNISLLAKGIDVSPNRISQIVNGKRAMSADTALRLERFLGWPARIWMEIQAEYDLELSRRRVAHGHIRRHAQSPSAGRAASGRRSA